VGELGVGGLTCEKSGWCTTRQATGLLMSKISCPEI
jgi:hypothetical protein